MNHPKLTDMHYVGIDVSQDQLDYALLNATGVPIQQGQITNDRKAIIGLIRGWKKKPGIVLAQSLFCLEPTGHYSQLLLEVLVELEAPTWLAHPMHIKQSLGDQRGKSDQLDALRIAQYAHRFSDQARMFTADNLKMTKLKQLLMKRKQLVEGRAKLKTQISHVNKHMHKELRASFNTIDKAQVRRIDSLLDRLEHLIQVEIEAHPEIHEKYELICSIPGIGPVLASNLLALTDAFSRFSSPRALACHCGVAPFEHSSGSSVRGKTRTSPKANTWLKSLLHMGAIVAMRNDPGLAAYYKRKVEQGKPKLSVINAIRAKLIHRVFAVLRKGEPYNPNLLQMS